MKKSVLFSVLTILFLLCLCLCACGETPSSTEESSSTEITDSTPISDTTSAPNSEVTTSQNAPTTKAPSNLVYAEATVSDSAYIEIPSLSYITGTLLHIDKNDPYQFNLSTLVPNNSISSATLEMKSQNLMLLYGNKSQDYVLSSAKLFVKKDAFPHWEAMMARFAGDTGKKSVQVVNAYLYSSESSIENSFITGYSFAVNIYENGITYSLSSKENMITVNGESMTCLDWFQDHCAEFGFIYTGLIGTQSQALATFRYVGRAHALTMKFYDVIDMEVYTNFIKSTNPTVSIKDSNTDITWKITYFPADLDSATTIIRLPIGAVYTISGNNLDGFIVAYYVPSGFETGV